MVDSLASGCAVGICVVVIDGEEEVLGHYVEVDEGIDGNLYFEFFEVHSNGVL